MPASEKASSPDRSPPGSPAGRPAIGSPFAVASFVILTAAALAGDLLSKHLVFDSLLNDPQLQARLAHVLEAHGADLTAREALRFFNRPVAPGVRMSLSTNPGVVFGLPMQRALVAVATAAIVAVVCYFFAVSGVRLHGVHAALALILAGALGNLYDRLFAEVRMPGFEPIRHQVRDFIDCSGLHYPWVFNVADVWLVVGVAVLAVHWVAGARPSRKTEPSGKKHA